MKQFLFDHGTLLVAIYGVVQVWIIALWKRYLKSGNIEVYHSGLIELGHSNFGPSLAVNGTFLAKHKEVFISEVHLVITRQKDNSTHKLNWTAFRPPVLNIGKQSHVQIEIPSGFIVKPDSPHRYHIFFSDNMVQRELNPILIALQKEWHKYLQDNTLHITGLMKTGKAVNIVREEIFHNDFSKVSLTYQTAWDLIRRTVFWEPGTYTVIMDISTDKKAKKYSSRWSFAVDSESFENFRLNSISTIAEICLLEYQYYNAYVPFQPPT
ncbi:hypothetical protein IH575_01615 [Candidatus Dojkabacteria bacterium]|nr:hypothetical protein [Candidatus Dojkabacteria bacterium]